ncbi:MAG: hypothetical protein ACTSO7_10905 [Candidatus Heimdallarchaeota archaeon]
MSKTAKSEKTSKSGLERLPENIPFLPVVRRPDYQLRFVKLSAPTSIPIELIIAVIFIGLFFIYMGGFYNIARDSIAFGTYNDQPYVIVRALDHQFLFEGMAAGILMFVGAGGMFMIYYSTQYAYSPKNATILLVVGIGVFVLAWVACMFMLTTKMGLQN